MHLSSLVAPALAFALLAPAARAEPPQVVADIAPVHSLVALVMAGVGEPVLLLPPGTPAHDAALRPSDARALTAADLVVWTGPALLPWVGDAIDSLAPDARALPLLDSEGWAPLPLRDGAGLHAHEGEAHDDHADEDPEEEAGAIDPHAWLDPEVAAAWLGTIAGALSESDPDHAALYRDNADRAAADLRAAGQAMALTLAPVAGVRFAAGHDALQYFERAMGLTGASGRIAPSDGAAAAPGEVAVLRDAIRAGEVACLLTDPETGPDWAATLTEGTDARVDAVDPEGVGLSPGPDLYLALLRATGGAFERCLAP